MFLFWNPRTVARFEQSQMIYAPPCEKRRFPALFRLYNVESSFLQYWAFAFRSLKQKAFLWTATADFFLLEANWAVGKCYLGWRWLSNHELHHFLPYLWCVSHHHLSLVFHMLTASNSWTFVNKKQSKSVKDGNFSPSLFSNSVLSCKGAKKNWHITETKIINIQFHHSPPAVKGTLQWAHPQPTSE